ncbi:MAG: hypothetical protein Kow0098_26320 [Ignavibacteriaceae bacterium]
MNETLNNKSLLKIVFSLIVLWIILFEFILPPDSFLPSPTSVIDTVKDLFGLYQFALGLLSTVTVVYVSLFLSYLLVWLFSAQLFNEDNPANKLLLALEGIFEFIPAIIAAFILIYWFPSSEFTEIVFATVFSFFPLMIYVLKNKKNVPEEYLLFSRSLTFTDSSINRKVLFRALQPRIYDYLSELHLILWSLLIAFEYIKGGLGIGVVLGKALEYKDIAAIFLIMIIVSLIVFAGKMVIIFIRNKFVVWE